MDRIKTILYNAIVLLEENYSHEEILEELGISEEEYSAIMADYKDTVCCTFGEKNRPY